jgi:hypothetical protein
MSGLLVQVGNVLSTFLGVALVVFGGYGAYWGNVSVEQSVAFAALALGVVAGYRSFTVRSRHWSDAVATAVLVVAGAGGFFAGAMLGIDLLQTGGQAVLALGCVSLLVRAL